MRVQVPFNLEYVTKLVADERAKAPAESQGPQYKYNTEVRLLSLPFGLQICLCMWCADAHTAN